VPPDNRVPVVGQAALDTEFTRWSRAVPAVLLRFDRAADGQARPPAGSSKADASRNKTEFGVKRKLFKKQLTCCDRNRQGKNYDIKSDTQRKIDQRIPRRIGFEFPQRDLIAQDRVHVEARAAEYLRAPLLGC